MKLFQTSGPALFMYTVIVCCLIASLVCFYVYYNAIFVNEIILWIGITTFTILYHFWGRIILGNVSKIFRRFISYKSWWFKERSFEKDLYEKLKVKKSAVMQQRIFYTYLNQFHGTVSGGLLSAETDLPVMGWGRVS